MAEVKPTKVTLSSERRRRIACAIKEYLREDTIPEHEKTASQKDLDAVDLAMDQLICERFAVDKLMFITAIFADGKTLAAAADFCYISRSTAKRWKRHMLELVDGYLMEER